jgi:CubicO group peptidase (beta-lactamase class C family)
LPDTPVGRHAAAWLEAYNSGDEAKVRAVYEQHFAASSLSRRPMADRLRVFRQIYERDGSLSPLRVVQSEERFLRLVTEAATGVFLQMDFECEKESPFGLVGIGVMPVRDPEAVAPRPPPVTATELPERFESYLAEQTAAGRFSGVVLVAKDGKPVLRKAYGLADRRFEAANREDTRFNMGSLGKLVTKLAIAQLAEAGQLSLDDPLERWLPDWPQETAGKITIEHLAEHRSGVPDFLNDASLRERFFQSDRSVLRHNRDFLKYFRDEPLLFEPGAARRYSNSGYVLLGEVIERVSGEDYYDYIRKHIHEPAGMKGTGSWAADDPEPNIARGYYATEGGTGPVRENTIHLWPRALAAGGGYTTVDDLLALDLVLQGAKLASPEWSAWVLGGPRPGSGDDTASIPDHYVLAGGAEGITARLDRIGPWVMVLLSNLDRGMMGRVEEHLHGWLRGVRE